MESISQLYYLRNLSLLALVRLQPTIDTCIATISNEITSGNYRLGFLFIDCGMQEVSVPIAVEFKPPALSNAGGLPTSLIYLSKSSQLLWFVHGTVCVFEFSLLRKPRFEDTKQKQEISLSDLQAALYQAHNETNPVFITDIVDLQCNLIAEYTVGGQLFMPLTGPANEVLVISGQQLLLLNDSWKTIAEHTWFFTSEPVLLKLWEKRSVPLSSLRSAAVTPPVSSSVAACQVTSSALINRPNERILYLSYADGGLCIVIIRDVGVIFVSEKLHLAIATAYPNTVDTPASTPKTYDLSTSGQCYNPEFTSMEDVEAIVSLPESVRRKVSKASAVVNSKRYEEIARVLQTLSINSGSVLVLLETKHINIPSDDRHADSEATAAPNTVYRSYSMLCMSSDCTSDNTSVELCFEQCLFLQSTTTAVTGSLHHSSSQDMVIVQLGSLLTARYVHALQEVLFSIDALKPLLLREPPTAVLRRQFVFRDLLLLLSPHSNGLSSKQQLVVFHSDRGMESYGCAQESFLSLHTVHLPTQPAFRMQRVVRRETAVVDAELFGPLIVLPEYGGGDIKLPFYHSPLAQLLSKTQNNKKGSSLLLIATNNQRVFGMLTSSASPDNSRASVRYLACIQPPATTTIAADSSSSTSLLWIMNQETKRWRSMSLRAAATSSSHHHSHSSVKVVKDIPAVTYHLPDTKGAAAQEEENEPEPEPEPEPVYMMPTKQHSAVGLKLRLDSADSMDISTSSSALSLSLSPSKKQQPEQQQPRSPLDLTAVREPSIILPSLLQSSSSLSSSVPVTPMKSGNNSATSFFSSDHDMLRTPGHNNNNNNRKATVAGGSGERGEKGERVGGGVYGYCPSPMTNNSQSHKHSSHQSISKRTSYRYMSSGNSFTTQARVSGGGGRGGTAYAAPATTTTESRLRAGSIESTSNSTRTAALSLDGIPSVVVAASLSSYAAPPAAAPASQRAAVLPVQPAAAKRVAVSSVRLATRLPLPAPATVTRSLSIDDNTRSSSSTISSVSVAVKALQWFGSHTLIMLTLRRATAYLEILSREPAAGIDDVAVPLVHLLYPLPPGYMPTILQVTDLRHDHCKDNKKKGRRYLSALVMIASERHAFAYQVIAVCSSTMTQSSSFILRYGMVELWSLPFPLPLPVPAVQQLHRLELYPLRAPLSAQQVSLFEQLVSAGSTLPVSLCYTMVLYHSQDGQLFLYDPVLQVMTTTAGIAAAAASVAAYAIIPSPGGVGDAIAILAQDTNQQAEHHYKQRLLKRLEKVGLYPRYQRNSSTPDASVASTENDDLIIVMVPKAYDSTEQGQQQASEALSPSSAASTSQPTASTLENGHHHVRHLQCEWLTLLTLSSSELSTTVIKNDKQRLLLYCSSVNSSHAVITTHDRLSNSLVAEWSTLLATRSLFLPFSETAAATAAVGQRRDVDSRLILLHTQQLLRSALLPTDAKQQTQTFQRLVQELYNKAPGLCLEAITRLARRLEPKIMRTMFPLPMLLSSGGGISNSSMSLIELYFSCLHPPSGRVDCAARLLSPTCEQLGGSESSASTTACLLLATELLSVALVQVNMRLAEQVIAFIARLEEAARQQLSSSSASSSSSSSLDALTMTDAQQQRLAKSTRKAALQLIVQHSVSLQKKTAVDQTQQQRQQQGIVGWLLSSAGLGTTAASNQLPSFQDESAVSAAPTLPVSSKLQALIAMDKDLGEDTASRLLIQLPLLPLPAPAGIDNVSLAAVLVSLRVRELLHYEHYLSAAHLLLLFLQQGYSSGRVRQMQAMSQLFQNEPSACAAVAAVDIGDSSEEKTKRILSILRASKPIKRGGSHLQSFLTGRISNACLRRLSALELSADRLQHSQHALACRAAFVSTKQQGGAELTWSQAEVIQALAMAFSCVASESEVGKFLKNTVVASSVN